MRYTNLHIDIGIGKYHFGKSVNAISEFDVHGIVEISNEYRLRGYNRFVAPE